MEDHHLISSGVGEPRSLALSSGYRAVSLRVEAVSGSDLLPQTQNSLGFPS